MPDKNSYHKLHTGPKLKEHNNIIMYQQICNYQMMFTNANCAEAPAHCLEICVKENRLVMFY